MSDKRSEAVYLVDRAYLLHLKEAQGGAFDFTVFDKETKHKVSEGKIRADQVMDGIDPIHDRLASARNAAIWEAGLDGVEVSQVGITTLRDFRDSDIRRRGMWEPETLPKDDIRFIDSRYQEQFRIPNGGTIEIEYPDRTLAARCEYIDDYHAYIGSEVYHMCQFAEVMERAGGVFRPETAVEAEQAAWQVGWNNALAVELQGDHWDYHLFDSRMNEIGSGQVEAAGQSVNEVRDTILAENKLSYRSRTPIDHDTLMAKAVAREQEASGEKRESVLGQLSTLKADAKEHKTSDPAQTASTLKKHREEAR